jgi:2-oxoglutarate ferredoxin oxidoreductase subunit beta
VTFRPEQSEWKHMLVPAPREPTSDPAEAARRLLRDHGLYTGVLYVGDRPVYQPKLESSVTDLDEFEEEFRL